MSLYPIEFIDKDNALRTGMTNDESWTNKGVWVLHAYKRKFIKMHRIIRSTQVLNALLQRQRKNMISKSEEKTN